MKLTSAASLTNHNLPLPVVLLVDDDRANLETLTQLLAGESCRIETVTNGPDALARAAELNPDVVLLDVMMPGMDGFRVCERLRATPALAEVPIVLVTALDDRESRLRGIEAGADDFISKPFDGTELRARVRALLRLNRYRQLLETREHLLRAQRLESIGLLAGGIAHDLNNILAPVLISSQLLEQRLADEFDRQLAGNIRVSAERGAGVVRQVLNFARGLDRQPAESQPRQIIREISSFAQDTFPRSIEVRHDLLRDVWRVPLEPTLLYQVLLNLCVNARDAMPDGGTLKFAAVNVVSQGRLGQSGAPLSAGEYVLLSVGDTGTGIPPEILARIWEPLFTTKAPGKGTGLGLATVARIVREHDGHIAVDSVVGKGTTFHIYLPAVRSKADAMLLLPPPPIPGRGELLLFVDDEATIREVARVGLESNGYRVLTAADGIEAILLFGQHRDEIAAVVLDLRMPHRDGRSTLHALRQADARVKVLVTSGEAGARSAFPEFSEGLRFLSKPYDSAQLLCCLHALLHGSNAEEKSTPDLIACAA
ncbi:MAG: PAS domain-containing protein [Limisphaerales bacterium]|nr:MAG: PAS domain-containing protein [Limisphaerales bacterium]KAG0507611.1 MAG: PAS domain-containing protein [Limisphaerales bacterium]TXT48212.1 MAG: PAS domain-containing protein [Limisphaerales bacterium]